MFVSVFARIQLTRGFGGYNGRWIAMATRKRRDKYRRGEGRCMRDELAALRKESEEKRFPADPSGIVIRVSR